MSFISLFSKFQVYGDTDIVIADVLAALLTMYCIDSKLIGDHDMLIETFKFLIYKVLRHVQLPKASLQEPDLAPKFVVLIASKTPACNTLGA